jgi:hypothetical protein
MTDTKPVAWHFKCDEYESVTLLKQHADAMAEFYKTKSVPLYHAATLTDAERQAIEWCIEQWAGVNRSTTLRNLLERMK